MEREPDLSALRALTLIAQSGSISAASHELGVSQQAVSLKIRALEREVAVPLLMRSARGSNLTSAGELVVGWARPLLEAAADYADAVATLKAGRAHALRIAASLTIAEHLLPEWISRWRTAVGVDGATASLTAANSDAVMAAVRSGAADLGFIETPLVPAGLGSVTIGHDRVVVVVPQTHPWKGRDITAAELARTPLVTREPGSGTRTTFEAALRAAGIEASAAPAAVHDSTLGVRSAVMAGVAPGALSVLAVRDDVAAGRLWRINVPGLEMSRPLTAIWSGDEPTADASGLLRVIAEEQGAVVPSGAGRGGPE